MFGVYSWAGEKFPWLMIHPLMPFLLLAAMFVVEVLQRRHTIRTVSLVLLALLTVLEIHNMYEVNFVNGADPVEMMVYVQSSPDTPKVAANIEAISNKATNGPDVNVTIDSLDTWPFAWYLRHLTHVGYPGYPQILNKGFANNPVIIVDETHQAALFPKLGGSYVGHVYNLRWWFPEDYKSLTWASFWQDLRDPGYWRVVAQWQLERRAFGPKEAVRFYYYVKKGFVAPF
jgi:predicted membrane-bound mannosyltransferase